MEMSEGKQEGTERAPITQGLRGRLRVAALGLAKPMVDGLMAECDNIDAIHKALEDENAELRETVFEHARSNVEVVTFLDRLSDAVEKREDVTLWGVDYTALPLDADGVPIHVGDDMQSVSEPAVHGTVYRMELTRDGWWIYFRGVGMRPKNYRHYHKPTVMDVLDELLMNWSDCEGPEDELALKQRCAKRLQLANREPLEEVEQ